ncbi:peptide transporter [Fulvitalea axinellae]|uniref:Peptide transporter n=1 Tax=Fulvitalea axinellae TaxID=1182444 RepID=A0AAU9CLZ6_9BACT|nr:peptide transporter [Fulvitalea axinellae]
MKRLFVSILCAVMVSGGAMAQKPVKGSVNKAKLALEKGKVEDAKIQIDAAFKNDAKGKVAKKVNSWFVKGEVYEKLAIDSTRTDIVDKQDLATSVSSFNTVLDKFQKSQDYVVLATQRIDNLWRTFFNSAAGKYESGEYSAAVADFENALVVRPTDSLTLLYSGITSQLGEMPEKALGFYDQMIKTVGADTTIWQQVIVLKKQEGDTLGALATAKEAKAMFPENKNIVSQELSLLIELDKIQEAETAMKAQIERDPNNPSYYYNLGYILDAQKKSDEALEAYKKAVELDPDYYDAIFNIAVVYYKEGSAIYDKARQMSWKEYEKNGKKVEEEAKVYFKKALPYLQRASEIKPESREALEALSSAYQILGENDKFEAIQKQIEALGQ